MKEFIKKAVIRVLATLFLFVYMASLFKVGADSLFIGGSILVGFAYLSITLVKIGSKVD